MLDPLFVLPGGQLVVQVRREGQVAALDLTERALAVALTFPGEEPDCRPADIGGPGC
jgi:hypothetical protein